MPDSKLVLDFHGVDMGLGCQESAMQHMTVSGPVAIESGDTSVVSRAESVVVRARHVGPEVDEEAEHAALGTW